MFKYRSNNYHLYFRFFSVYKNLVWSLFGHYDNSVTDAVLPPYNSSYSATILDESYMFENDSFVRENATLTNASVSTGELKTNPELYTVFFEGTHHEVRFIKLNQN